MDYTRDSARLHAASVEFAALMKRYGEKSTLHDYARKLSREAYRFHTSAISADPRSSKVLARYDELAKYYYRFECSYYDSLDYGHGRGSRLARSYHELSIALGERLDAWLDAAIELADTQDLLRVVRAERDQLLETVAEYEREAGQ